MVHTCAVMGCEDKTATRHRFPNLQKDRERYNVWVNMCGNAKLQILDPNSVYKSYRVCHIYFTDADKSTNMFIWRTAVPSRNLPGIHASSRNIVNTQPDVEMAVANVSTIIPESPMIETETTYKDSREPPLLAVANVSREIHSSENV